MDILFRASPCYCDLLKRFTSRRGLNYPFKVFIIMVFFSQERSHYSKKYSGLFGWMWERVKPRTNHRSGSPQLETGPRKGYSSGFPLTMPDRTPSNH